LGSIPGDNLDRVPSGFIYGNQPSLVLMGI
jgi:hypothetical protein